ncbi:MAG: hypothetical protein ACYS22_10960 [Planctomycetota bacterium]
MRRTLFALAAATLLALGAPPGFADDLKLDPVEFTFAAGQHRATGAGAGPAAPSSEAAGRTVAFKVRFGRATKYATVDPKNQLDWNKIMGISTLLIHGDSIRLGWRYDPKTDRIQLGFYGYIRNKRISEPITHVKRGRWAKVALSLSPSGLAVTVNGKTVEREGPLGVTAPSFILRTAYFGGDETAPHPMKIDVKDIVVGNP